MATLVKLRKPLDPGDALALRQAVSGRAFLQTDNTTPLVRTLINVLPPQTLLDIVNGDTEISSQVFNVDLHGLTKDEQAKLLILFEELEDLPLPPYAVDRYPIYEKGVNLLYGLPGIGKSFIALDFIGHVAAKHPDKAVIYIAPEGWSSIPVRWKAWCKHYSINPVNTFIMRQPLRLSKHDEINAFKEACTQLIGKPIHFIVIDTLARAMTGDNENDTREMNLFIDAAERLRTELDCGILFVHHVNKQGLLRGSSVLEGALDSMIKAHKDDAQIVLHNAGDKGGKNRHREEMPPVYLNFVSVEVEIEGIVNTSVVVEVGEKLTQTPTKETLTQRQREMLEVLDGHDDGVTVKQLQEATNIPKPTLYRYAKLLQTAGYLTHDR